MRIWLINHYAVPPTQPGGTRHYSLARELIRNGHEVIIIASSFAHGAGSQIELKPSENYRLETVEGVPFLWLRTPSYAGNNLGRMRNMQVFATRLWSMRMPPELAKPDVVIGSSQHLLAVLAAERLSRRYKVPFVFEVRDLMPQTLIDMGSMAARHPVVIVLEHIERYLYRRANRIISLLPGAVDHMVAKGARRDKIVWIPNGIDLDFAATPVPPPVHARFTVMYAGSHGQANGMDTILDAAAILQCADASPAVEFHLVGEGTQKERLRQRAESEGLRNVRFEDPVPKTEIYQTLQSADAFVVTLKNLPLYRWGMSLNKLFDYLVSARPIVFGADIANDPVASAQAGLTVPPEDAGAMARAIQQLTHMSPEERWQMGLRGRRFVEDNYDLRKLAGNLERLLCDVVGGSPG